MPARHRFPTALALFALAALGPAAPRAAAQDSTIIDLGTLGGASSRGFAINAAGQVVGTSDTASHDEHVFLWQDGVMTDLGTLVSRFSYPRAINNNGQVAGDASLGSTAHRAYLWQDGVTTDLGTLGGIYSYAGGLNDAGQVVGKAQVAGPGVPPFHAFLWQGGVMQDLGTLGRSDSSAAGINNAGQVVGQARTAGPEYAPYHAFLWQAGVMQDLGTLGGSDSSAAGINDLGQVTGSADTAGGYTHAFVWQDGVMTDLGTLPGDTTSFAFGLNNGGQVVGASGVIVYDIEGSYFSGQPVLWSGGVPTALRSLLPPDSGWTFLELTTAINDAGQITGSGFHNGLWHAFLLSLPAPAAGPAAALARGRMPLGPRPPAAARRGGVRVRRPRP
jgi:probable HAF family extracellular repeat protein